jgi:hypothetical protein
MRKRPSLAESMQKVARPGPGDQPEPGGANRQQESRFHAATREGKKKITIVLNTAAHAQLRHLSIDLGRSGEALAVEAINDLFQKYGKPPIA